jgi:hypothetical protein
MWFACCGLQVYRGKWCGIDIAAREYQAVEGEETEWREERQRVQVWMGVS